MVVDELLNDIVPRQSCHETKTTAAIQGHHLLVNFPMEFFSSLKVGIFSGMFIIQEICTLSISLHQQALKLIGTIEAAKEVIENSPLVPAWEAKFRKMLWLAPFTTARTLKAMSPMAPRKGHGWGENRGPGTGHSEVLTSSKRPKFIESFDQAGDERRGVQAHHELTTHRILPEETVGLYRKKLRWLSKIRQPAKSRSGRRQRSKYRFFWRRFSSGSMPRVRMTCMRY